MKVFGTGNAITEGKNGTGFQGYFGIEESSQWYSWFVRHIGKLVWGNDVLKFALRRRLDPERKELDLLKIQLGKHFSNSNFTLYQRYTGGGEGDAWKIMFSNEGTGPRQQDRRQVKGLPNTASDPSLFGSTFHIESYSRYIYVYCILECKNLLSWEIRGWQWDPTTRGADYEPSDLFRRAKGKKIPRFDSSLANICRVKSDDVSCANIVSFLTTPDASSRHFASRSLKHSTTGAQQADRWLLLCFRLLLDYSYILQEKRKFSVDGSTMWATVLFWGASLDYNPWYVPSSIWGNTILIAILRGRWCPEG